MHVAGTPALAIGGSEDFMSPPEVMRTLLGIPGAEHVAMPGLGHLPFVEEPEAFASEVRAWWARSRDPHAR